MWSKSSRATRLILAIPELARWSHKSAETTDTEREEGQPGPPLLLFDSIGPANRCSLSDRFRCDLQGITTRFDASEASWVFVAGHFLYAAERRLDGSRSVS